MAVTARGESQRRRPATERARAELESFNPATGELVGSVPTITPDQVQAVVDDVAGVQPFWAQLSLADRARYCGGRRRCSSISPTRSPSCSRASRASRGSSPTRWSCCRRSTRCTGAPTTVRGSSPTSAIPYPQLMLKQKKSKFVYEPIGVVGVIAPWNYPWSIPFGEVAIALMAGNGVVLKPASLTPLIGQRIQECSSAPGFPRGWSRRCTAAARSARRWSSRRAGKIFFTGSVEVGRGVGEECARRMKGSRARAGRQGSADRVLGRATSRTRSPGPSGAGSRMPGRPARASSAPT